MDKITEILDRITQIEKENSDRVRLVEKNNADRIAKLELKIERSKSAQSAKNEKKNSKNISKLGEDFRYWKAITFGVALVALGLFGYEKWWDVPEAVREGIHSTAFGTMLAEATNQLNSISNNAVSASTQAEEVRKYHDSLDKLNTETRLKTAETNIFNSTSRLLSLSNQLFEAQTTIASQASAISGLLARLNTVETNASSFLRSNELRSVASSGTLQSRVQIGDLAIVFGIVTLTSSQSIPSPTNHVTFASPFLNDDIAISMLTPTTDNNTGCHVYDIKHNGFTVVLDPAKYEHAGKYGDHLHRFIAIGKSATSK